MEFGKNKQVGLARVLATFLFCVMLRGDEPIPRLSGYSSRFEGPALRLKCVAELKRTGWEAFVEKFRQKTTGQRRACLSQLLVSLNPEPDFTPAEFKAALRPRDDGDYDFLPSTTIAGELIGRLLATGSEWFGTWFWSATTADRMVGRLGVNSNVA